ncbi:MAG: beta-hydroxyacyl-ACP dehydratase [Phycisphaeraceae bacterium]|nr:beta-hydroxyacyl-ACP dehydratase [Phycisphaeraceae bacterium]
MRWMWIDRIIELDKGTRLVAIKHVSMGEEHLHDHFPAGTGPQSETAGTDARAPRPALPVMPASLIIEGMAQSAGILVGHANQFREKVLLAKIARAELDADAGPGDTLRYTATIQSLSDQGASTAGIVERRRADEAEFAPFGRIDLMFSHADNAMDMRVGGVTLPRENFVFGEGFKTLLRTSGIE